MLTESILYGMKLWAFQLIPALFPFMILTGMFLWFHDKYMRSDKIGRINMLLCRLWNLSPNGIYILILGHICGYPSGAQMIADRYKNGKISLQEAYYLLTISNQSSPAFIYSYFITYALNRSDEALGLFLMLYIGTFLTSLITRSHYLKAHRYPKSIYMGNLTAVCCPNTSAAFDKSKIQANHFNTPVIEKKDANKDADFFTALDNSIVNSASICIKICGYIILFSVLSAITMQLFSRFAPLNQYITSSLELTYGLSLLRNAKVAAKVKDLLLLGCFSFGGFCTMAQIKGMLVGTSLSIKPYIIGKGIYTVIVSILFKLCI